MTITHTEAHRRIVAVLALADDEPDLDEVLPYLHDSDAEVRRAAVDVLVEGAPEGVEQALAAALQDPAGVVRAAAAAGLRELEDVLELDPDVVSLLLEALTAGDPTVTEAVLIVARKHSIGTSSIYAEALGSPAESVRIEAVHGLVSLNDVDTLSAAANDRSRAVRVTVAKALGTIGAPAGVPALAALAADGDPLVRAAAFSASAALGAPLELRAAVVSGASDPQWEVRVGAAQGLATGPTSEVVPVLSRLAVDVHLDVRKAAVRALARHASEPDVREVLTGALGDTDADVRAYARLALE